MSVYNFSAERRIFNEYEKKGSEYERRHIMLDEKDLQAIARLILDSEERINKKFGRLDRKLESLETRIESLETRIESLETRIESLETRVENLETRMENLEKRFDCFEKKTERRFDILEARLDLLEERLKDTTDVLVDEIGRVQVYLEKQITEVRKRLDNVEEYYKNHKIEQENTVILFKMQGSLEKRVSILEKNMS